MPFASLAHLLRLLGPFGIIVLIFRKILRTHRYRKMLRDVPRSNAGAQLLELNFSGTAPSSDLNVILSFADALLRDENKFFTFPYHTRGLELPWEYDPIEQRYWPRRHYTERMLHSNDTPGDVKIVFEINRFKELPSLGQAAIITKESKYAEEAERRILSWIENNTFANSVNWSSALEIAIRLISWSTALTLLKRSGFDISSDPRIRRSIYEQVCYLAADMGTDKVVPTNHLIGEATGVFVVSSLFAFPKAERFRNWSQKILENEIIRQTFTDGVTKESSSWYHQFVTDFFDLADRIAISQKLPFSEAYRSRLSQMRTFTESMRMNGEVVRYGDSDDGWALWFAGNIENWKNFVFGASTITSDTENYFPNAEVIAVHGVNSFLFLRAGEFGMGGSGFSSHAHDDFLSPIIFLDGESILTDPGTFIYNNDEANRILYRRASSHNSIVLADKRGMFSTGAVSKPDFGWESIRPSAKILKTEFGTDSALVSACYSEWPQHTREISVEGRSAFITDTFSDLNSQACEWHLHFHPQWHRIETEGKDHFEFQNHDGKILKIGLQGDFEYAECESYDYSPSYRVAIPAACLRMTSSRPRGLCRITLTLSR